MKNKFSFKNQDPESKFISLEGLMESGGFTNEGFEVSTRRENEKEFAGEVIRRLLPRLSRLEKRVLALMRHGGTQKTVAVRLGLSSGTVMSVMARIRRKAILVSNFM